MYKHNLPIYVYIYIYVYIPQRPGVSGWPAPAARGPAPPDGFEYGRFPEMQNKILRHESIIIRSVFIISNRKISN